MGMTGDQENAARDGDGAPGSAAAQPPAIPGLHPETQELLTARYGRPAGPYGPPAPRYGRPQVTRYSVKAFVIGWLVAYGMVLVFSLVAAIGTTVIMLTPAESPTADLAPSLPAVLGSTLMLLVYIPLFAAFPALFIGVPAALGVVFALRNVRNQWWHVLGFAVAGFLTPMPALLFMGLGGNAESLGAWLLLGGAGALCAVVGRLAIWKLVEVAAPLPSGS